MSTCRGRGREAQGSPWGDTRGQGTHPDGLLHAHVRGVAPATQPAESHLRPVSTLSAPRGLGHTSLALAFTPTCSVLMKDPPHPTPLQCTFSQDVATPPPPRRAS